MLTVSTRPARRPVEGPRLTDIALYAWVAQSAAGDRLEYYRGFIGVDVVPVMSRLPDPDRRQLVDLARAAFASFEAGLVHLVQVRHGPDHFAYIAIARPKPGHAAAALSALLNEDQAA